MQFTPEQQAALDLHLHCAVHANAGSGKTSVVTHRFVKILIESGAQLDQIIAITFTRAAATEMRERIHRLLIEAQNSPEMRATFASTRSDEELCRQLRQWSSSISTARISTFHSFCAGLVRQYAEELELDAELQEIDSVEANVLVDDAVRRAITEHVSAEAPPGTSLTTVFDDVSIDVVRKIVARATGDTSMAAVLARGSTALTHEQRHRVINAHCRAVARDILHGIQDLLASLADVPTIAAILATSRALAVRCADDADDHVVAEVVGLYNTAFTTKHILRSRLLSKDVLATMESLPGSTTDMQSGLELLSTPWHGVQEQRFDEILATINAVTSTARAYYRRAKRERNAIDFDDMIHLTLELLQDTSIVTSLRKSVRFIMVDEFQDTDPLQYEVLSKLAPALDGEDVPTPNVCIVGDDKQSIYGFRDADVRLFRRATYALQRANLHRGTDTGYRPLVTSFRMHERVASSVNAICTAMFGAVATPPITDTTSYDVGYQPLRSVAAPDISEHVGTCAIVLAPHDESEAIANHIGNMLNGTLRREIPVYDRSSDAWTTRSPRPSDIAVLVQTNDQVVGVGEALAQLHIPADLHGGASFFARPEVMDIRALLTACIAPSDNLAVATLCRSPLLRCTDAELATAALVGRRSSFRDGLATCVADGTPSEHLRRAHTLIQEWESASQRMSPSALVQYALDSSGWYATLAVDERREQILANVEKALELIRNAVDGNGGTLYDAVTALHPLNGDRERDGVVPSDGDAVRVMTIHASKGLEFGIVVLGGLATKGRQQPYYSTDEIGIAFSLATDTIDPHALGAIEKLPVLRSLVMAKQRTSQRETAEFRRRLYVALTRAKSHLSIIHADEEVHDNLPRMAGVLGSALAVARNHVSIIPNPTSEPFVGSTAERHELMLLGTLEQPPVELVAPSQFMQSHRWNEDGVRMAEGDSAGAAYGIAVHDVIATTLPVGLDLDRTERLAVIARSLAAHQLDRDRATEAALEIMALFDSPLITSHADVLRTARREVRLISTLDDVAIQGILDCRFEHADGSMSVWDWKTNAVRTESDVDELAQVYHRQLQTYAWLCLRAYPTCDTVTTRLIFTKAIAQGLASVDRSIVWTRSQCSDIELDLRRALAELRTSSHS